MVQLSQLSKPNNSFTWEDLLSLLRDELQEYGGLVGLLNAQQQSILNRNPQSLLEVNRSVQNQIEASKILHKRREGFVSTLASNYGHSDDVALSEILEHFPSVTQPMFQSIIEEINNLITQIRKRIAQNGRLLSRLTDVTDQLLTVTDPASHSKTYSKSGDLSSLSFSKRASLNESA
jgi:flagellar biosynthesis/type III secretory pathway chaperone